MSRHNHGMTLCRQVKEIYSSNQGGLEPLHVMAFECLRGQADQLASDQWHVHACLAYPAVQIAIQRHS
jgi:hypothetical protein